MKIRIDVEGTRMTATLEDNATARAFASLLPLTLTLEDYSATEKISDLPKRLSTKDAPPGVDPSIGDITYYAPWGNLAVFYKDFGYSAGLIKIGAIDSRMEAFQGRHSLKATITRLDEPTTPAVTRSQARPCVPTHTDSHHAKSVWILCQNCVTYPRNPGATASLTGTR